MEKRWQFGRPDSGLIQALTEQLHISPVLAQVLANRGIADAGEASHFLHDTLADMADPFLMKGMDAAVQRLEQAITENSASSSTVTMTSTALRRRLLFIPSSATWAQRRSSTFPNGRAKAMASTKGPWPS